MEWKWTFRWVTLFIVVIVMLFSIGMLIMRALWGWVIPDLFAGAVENGLIAGSLSWWQAFKLLVFVGLLFGGARGSK